MISYAQNAEDVVLARAFADVHSGFYVDIGANDPTDDSVTRHFYDLGWSGINVEPQAPHFRALCEARPRDTNLNVGIGGTGGQLTFFEIDQADGMSTFSEEYARGLQSEGYTFRTHRVDVISLAQLHEEFVQGRTIDFLKVDVEGFEEHVLGDVDWSVIRPRVVVVETPVGDQPWRNRMLAHGYRKTLWDGINEFFVREEDEERLGTQLSMPATILDRYDPWHYVKQLLASHARGATLAATFISERLGAHARRSGMALDRAHIEAACALGAVYAARPDVSAAFGEGTDLDVDALTRWAVCTAQYDDPAAIQLEPHIPALKEIVEAQPRLTRLRILKDRALRRLRNEVKRRNSS